MPSYCWFDHFLDSRAEFRLIFRSVFGQWSFKKNCFWDLPTFINRLNDKIGLNFRKTRLHWIGISIISVKKNVPLIQKMISHKWNQNLSNYKNLYVVILKKLKSPIGISITSFFRLRKIMYTILLTTCIIKPHSKWLL